MADKTDNIKTRLSFDGEAQYKAACKEINSTLKVLNSEMKLVTAEYRDNASSAEALKAKQTVLQKTYDEQAKKVKATEEALDKCRQATGENSEESKKLEAQLNYQKAALVKTEQELKKTADELEKAEQAADEMGEEIEDSGQQAEEAGGKFSGLSGILNGLGGAMSKGVAALGKASAAIGAAVVAGLGYTVSQADEAKGALNNFCAATNTATEDAGKYKQVMENIYNGNYGEGFEDIAAAMTEVRQQAGDLGAGELEKMTTNALTLRDTFDFDVAESTRAATQLMQKFGLSSDEAYNLIAQGAQNGLNKNGDLLDVINEYSNQYSQAGLSAEDMFNSISNGAATGVWSIDKMGDAFKEFSIRMNDGTANDYLSSLGLNADEVVKKFQEGGSSAKEAMNQVSEALKNCDDKSLQYTTGVGLMGTMWEDMGADACISLMDVEGQISKTTDAMGKINAVKYDTFGEAMQGAGRILQTSFIMPIGEQALPIFSQFANELQQGAAAAGGDIGKMAQSFGDALGNLVNGLSEMLPQIATFAVEMVNGLVGGIVESAPTIIQAGVDMIVSLVDGIITAVPLLVAAMPKIIMAIVTGLITGIPKILEAAGKLVANIVTKLGELVTLIPGAIKEAITKLAEWGANMQSKGKEVITALVTNVVNIVKELPGKIWNSIVDAVTKVATWGVNMQNKAKEVMTSMVTKIVTVVKETPGKIWNSIVDAVTKVATWGTNMQNKAKETMNAMVTKIVSVVKEIPTKIYNSISGAVEKVGTWGTNMLNKAKSAMESVVQGVVGAFSNIGSKFADIGSNMVQGIWNGISNGWNWLKDKVSSLASSLLDAAKNALGIESPSKKFRDEVGVFIAQGIGVGFSDEMKSVNKQIEDAIPQEFDIGAKVNLSKDIDIDGEPKKPKPKGGAAGGVVVNQYIYANTTDYAKQQKEAARQFRMIARTV